MRQNPDPWDGAASALLNLLGGGLGLRGQCGPRNAPQSPDSHQQLMNVAAGPFGPFGGAGGPPPTPYPVPQSMYSPPPQLLYSPQSQSCGSLPYAGPVSPCVSPTGPVCPGLYGGLPPQFCPSGQQFGLPQGSYGPPPPSYGSSSSPYGPSPSPYGPSSSPYGPSLPQYALPGPPMYGPAGPSYSTQLALPYNPTPQGPYGPQTPYGGPYGQPLICSQQMLCGMPQGQQEGQLQLGQPGGPVPSGVPLHPSCDPINTSGQQKTGSMPNPSVQGQPMMGQGVPQANGQPHCHMY